MGEKIVAILHMYWARAILIIFKKHKDTESESQRMEIDVAWPMFTYCNISKALRDNGIHTTQYGRKSLWQLFIFKDLEQFSTLVW